MEISLKTTDDLDVIREESTKLLAMIHKRDAEIKALRSALHHYQRICPHPGQRTGYNERDGNWANVCRVCGESH